MSVARCPACGRVMSGTSCYACGHGGKGDRAMEEETTAPTPAALIGFDTRSTPHVGAPEKEYPPAPAVAKAGAGQAAPKPAAPANQTKPSPRPQNPFAAGTGKPATAPSHESPAKAAGKPVNPFATPSGTPGPAKTANPFAKAKSAAPTAKSAPKAVAPAPVVKSQPKPAPVNDDNGVFTSVIPERSVQASSMASEAATTKKVEISMSYLEGLDTLDGVRPGQSTSELDTQIPSEASLVERLGALASALEDEKRSGDAALIYEAVASLMSSAE